MGDNVGIHKWYSSTSRPAGTDVNWFVAKANQHNGRAFSVYISYDGDASCIPN